MAIQFSKYIGHLPLRLFWYTSQGGAIQHLWSEKVPPQQVIEGSCKCLLSTEYLHPCGTVDFTTLLNSHPHTKLPKRSWPDSHSIGTIPNIKLHVNSPHYYRMNCRGWRGWVAGCLHATNPMRLAGGCCTTIRQLHSPQHTSTTKTLVMMSQSKKDINIHDGKLIKIGSRHKIPSLRSPIHLEELGASIQTRRQEPQ